MPIFKLAGAIVFTLGVLLLMIAYNASQAPMEDLTNTITGRYSDNTLLFAAAGIAATVGGGLLAVFGLRK
ncbi:MAG: DUF3185 family protein [Rhodospirillales bacterium]|jgi:hypothetical protein